MITSSKASCLLSLFNILTRFSKIVHVIQLPPPLPPFPRIFSQQTFIKLILKEPFPTF